VLINENIKNECKSSAQNTLLSVKSDSDSKKHLLVIVGDIVTQEDVQAKLKTSLTRILMV
jgi:uncharacterized protein (UPF0218 family)